MAQSVLRGTHGMLGCDWHTTWPPGAPAPQPAPAPYLTAERLLASDLTVLHASSVFSETMSPAMLRGTDIGPGIVHAGPPSLTLALEIATSGSKSHFGASAIELRDQHGKPGHLASAVLGLAGLNLNCGAPSPTPFGMVVAQTTVQHGLRFGDVVVGLQQMATDYLLQRISARLGELAAHRGAGAIDVMGQRLGAGLLGRVTARFAGGTGGRRLMGAAARAGRDAIARNLAQVVDGVKLWGATPFSFAIGSPLGPSLSNIHDAGDQPIVPLPSSLELAVGAAERVGALTDDAVKAYLADPSIAEVPPGL